MARGNGEAEARPTERSVPGRRSRLRTARRILLWAAAAAVILAAALLFAVWVWWRFDPGDGQRSRGINALWAAHTWVGDPHSDDEYRQFADLLIRNQISDVFVHAGPLDADGTVPDERVAHAADLLAAMRRYAPAVRVQAYLGQIEKGGGGSLDLGDDAVRSAVVETAGRFLDMGFRGIHYDIEPVYPGDAHFLDLLQRTHQLTEAHGAVLSVALEQLEFAPGAQRVIGFFWRSYNDSTNGFLRDVADRVDQVAIMTYDSGLPTDWMFGAYMAWQTERVVGAVGDRVTVFMGVPTYRKGSFLKFHSRAENMHSGIRGIRKGLDRVDRDKTGNVGVAIFAEWTTTDQDWRTYASDWLGERAP